MFMWVNKNIKKEFRKYNMCKCLKRIALLEETIAMFMCAFQIYIIKIKHLRVCNIILTVLSIEQSNRKNYSI